MTTAHERFVAAQSKLNAAPIEIDLASTALLIIDMQEYFVNPQSPFSRMLDRRASGLGDYFQARSKAMVEPNLARLLDFFRGRKQRVIFTTVASECADGSDWAPAFKRMNDEARAGIGETALPARTDPWARMVEALEPNEDEVVINKTTFGAFASTGLDATLRNLGIKTLVLGGVVTNRCVETTMRDGTDRGYRVILVDDASATYSQEMQDATTLSLQGAYGFVRQTDEVLSLLAQAPSEPVPQP
ncbi:MAG: cysteine hydrolase [Alphaproteobacteria bacterium]|nr:cysteine hydrolase [Alphaproteobacteria bacterium]MBL6954715.1 cysteine hydrolase [Alphaproteobacteria bacterium]